MIPVLTPEESARADARATSSVETLIESAGANVARAALRLLGGSYGAHVVVVAGKGNNGRDGCAAAVNLERRGARVTVVGANELAGGEPLPEADLVIDAAYGTGLTRGYDAPDPGPTPVLAVDIPSGVSGLTGVAKGSPMRATETVTFAALKPGHLLADGPELSGTIELADIGLADQVDHEATCWLCTDSDVRSALPRRPRDGNKWRSAVQVVAGSPGMTGAPVLVATSCLRAGAGYVRLGLPGVDPSSTGIAGGEWVSKQLSETDWDKEVLEGLERFAAMVIGPGLGAVGGKGAGGPVGRLLSQSEVPVVVDADGLNSLGTLSSAAEVAGAREGPMILTPHDGEFARLTGEAPGEDRIESVRNAAKLSGCVVLLKGSTTVVSAPDGRVLLSSSGSPSLATAGTGDVLSGMIGALLARGVPALEAAAFGAHIHGRAAELGRKEGLIASDIPGLVAEWLSSGL